MNTENKKVLSAFFQISKYVGFRHRPYFKTLATAYKNSIPSWEFFLENFSRKMLKLKILNSREILQVSKAKSRILIFW